MDYISKIGIKFELVARGRHQKNAIESKHGIIRTVFLRLFYDEESISKEAAAYKAISISNNLYGNNVMSTSSKQNECKTFSSRRMCNPGRCN